ncbi:MAG: DUF2188 domain-containing protein [Saprospiraceae bacterium]
MAEQKAYYTKALGRKVALGARPNEVSKIHVISGPSNTWSVVAEGSVVSERSSLNKRSALSYARKSATRKAAKFIVIHDKNGDVAKRIKVS